MQRSDRSAGRATLAKDSPFVVKHREALLGTSDATRARKRTDSRRTRASFVHDKGRTLAVSSSAQDWRFFEKSFRVCPRRHASALALLECYVIDAAPATEAEELEAEETAISLVLDPKQSATNDKLRAFEASQRRPFLSQKRKKNSK